MDAGSQELEYLKLLLEVVRRIYAMILICRMRPKKLVLALA